MQILAPLKNFKSRLTKIGKSEPLHFFSLVIIIALDIFVLMNIFQGLYLQKQQLDQPHEVIPYSCQNFFIHPDSPEKIYDQKLRIIENAVNTESYFSGVSNKYASAVEIIEKRNKAKVDSRCRELYTEAKSLYTSKTLNRYFDDIETSERIINSKNSENSRYRGNYDTMLLENIANQRDELSIIDGKSRDVKAKIQANKNNINREESKISGIQTKILENSESQKLLQLISIKQPEIESTLTNLQFWYPLKKLFSQLIFLLPLFFFFLWLYRRMIQKENSLVSLIASHLLLVTLIPLILKVFELLLDILPFHFFSDLLELLEALNIVALFNYIVIIGAIILVVGIIYFLQKKVFSAQKTWEKRIQKKQCWSCGSKKANTSEKFCAFCGATQFETCSHCNVQKTAKTEFCGECGTK